MSNDKRNEFAGELLPPEVIRKGIYELGKVDRVPPAVGIFDSPTRCFVVNVEWWSHIAGMVHLLADVVSWRDADDESYFAITEILKFMQGMECMDFALRQKPDDSCIMQQTLDGGATWTDVFDFSECVTIQDKSLSVNITNALTNYAPTFESIYNNYVANYAGNPSDVYPGLEAPTGDDSAYNSAYCNAVYTLVSVASDSAVAFYTEVIDDAESQLGIFGAFALFVVAAIGIAGAIPTGGASLSLTAMASSSALVAAGIGLGAGLVLFASDYLRAHTKEEFQDEEARAEVTCYLVDEVAAADNTYAAMQAALASHTLTGNAASIANYLKILFDHDSHYAAFLEKWNNNNQYAEAGIDLYCPCATEYKVWVWDFSNGMGEFTFDVGPAGSDCVGVTLGTFVGGRTKGVTCGSQKALGVKMPFNPAWRVRGVKVHTERINGIAHGTFDQTTARFRPTPGSDSGSIPLIVGGGLPNGEVTRCTMYASAPLYFTGINEFWVSSGVFYDDDPVSDIYIDKIEIHFEADYAKGGYITDDDDFCV